jgi:hypothetical protein
VQWYVISRQFSNLRIWSSAMLNHVLYGKRRRQKFHRNTLHLNKTEDVLHGPTALQQKCSAFCNVRLCILVDRYKYFVGTYFPTFRVEDSREEKEIFHLFTSSRPAPWPTQPVGAHSSCRAVARAVSDVGRWGLERNRRSNSSHRCSMGFRSELWAGQLISGTLFWQNIHHRPYFTAGSIVMLTQTIVNTKLVFYHRQYATCQNVLLSFCV